jgi:hypothetical protein
LNPRPGGRDRLLLIGRRTDIHFRFIQYELSVAVRREWQE